MKDHVVKVAVTESWSKEGVSVSGKKWQRVDAEGSAQEGSCIITDAPVFFSYFVPMSEQATPFRKGELISISLDSIEFTKRKIVVKGQLVP